MPEPVNATHIPLFYFGGNITAVARTSLENADPGTVWSGRKKYRRYLALGGHISRRHTVDYPSIEVAKRTH